MGTGLLEKILTRRYGKPTVSIMDGFVALCWNPDDCDYDTVLYMGMRWSGKLGKRFASFEPIYGDAIGGYLLKNDLRAAVLPDYQIYGIWNIRDLRRQPEVKRALQ
jgi:hypothetical protein